MNDNLDPKLFPEAYYWLRLAQFGILASMGGAAKFISVALKSNEIMTPRRFMLSLAANVFVSGFAGLMGALMLATISKDPTLQSVAAGVFGWMGAITMDGLALLMQKKMNGVAGPVSNVVPIPSSLDPAAQTDSPIRP